MRERAREEGRRRTKGRERARRGPPAPLFSCPPHGGFPVLSRVSLSFVCACSRRWRARVWRPNLSRHGGPLGPHLLPRLPSPQSPAARPEAASGGREAVAWSQAGTRPPPGPARTPRPPPAGGRRRAPALRLSTRSTASWRAAYRSEAASLPPNAPAPSRWHAAANAARGDRPRPCRRRRRLRKREDNAPGSRDR